MKLIISTVVVAVAVSAAVSAQSSKQMNEPKMADEMNMKYTGCVEAVNHGGALLLTHIANDHDAMMHHDGMMKNDADMPQKNEPRVSSQMHGGEHMMPSAILLTGRSDLKKHIGHKVTVSGSLSHGMAGTLSSDRDTLSVTSLKVVGKSCS
jgi:hypothetical protein